MSVGADVRDDVAVEVVELPGGSSMRIELDVEIEARDGVVLRADVYRPDGVGRSPVIMTVGPYGKSIPFETFNKRAYDLIDERGARVNWETPTPDWWVAHGYTVVRVDQRGTGASDGRLNLHHPQQSLDFYDAIEWGGAQPWSNGKVGLLGVSYYAIAQWQVAALRPPSLAAIVPWEGASDLYREWAYHGGMANKWWMDAWFNRQVVPNQSSSLGADKVLPGNVDHPAELAEHEFDDDYFAERRADLENIEVPLLSAGNWGGAGLHLRGNIEGFLRAGSRHKWLSMHTGNHTTPFYTPEGKELQRKFLDYWLKGEQNGMLEVPPVRLDIRRGATTTERYEDAWPIPRTSWTRMYLDASSGSLDQAQPATASGVSYQAPGGEVRFVSDPVDHDVEITGPLAGVLFMSTTNVDMNVCVALIELDENGHEVVFDASRYEPNSVAYGWLRASHRELDPERTEDYRPYHLHRQRDLVAPGEVVRLDVELWPASVVIQAGHRLAVVVSAHDFHTSSFHHLDTSDPSGDDVFSGTHSVRTGGDTASYVLLPVIPAVSNGGEA